jgi:ribosomal protein S18 acetylase RimI-like enzyme
MLWLAVHHHHTESMPRLAPYVSGSTSWHERRALYEELLRKDDSILLLASHEERLVGYALLHVLAARDSWAGDTWATDDRIAELESLSVLSTHRGAGIGKALIRACHDYLRSIGVQDVIVGVLPDNTGALRLYEQFGYQPTFLYLSRFAGRGE